MPFFLDPKIGERTKKLRIGRAGEGFLYDTL